MGQLSKSALTGWVRGTSAQPDSSVPFPCSRFAYLLGASMASTICPSASPYRSSLIIGIDGLFRAYLVAGKTFPHSFSTTTVLLWMARTCEDALVLNSAGAVELVDALHVLRLRGSSWQLYSRPKHIYRLMIHSTVVRTSSLLATTSQLSDFSKAALYRSGPGVTIMNVVPGAYSCGVLSVSVCMVRSRSISTSVEHWARPT